MAYSYDFTGSLINVVAQTTVDCQDLYNSIAQEQASAVGICFPAIAAATGKQSLGGSVSVGLTVQLLGAWQCKFQTGNYVATIAGGNLVGGIGGDPVAYSAGVQVLIIQSAASTIVATTSGGGTGLTQQQVRDAMSLAPTLASGYPAGSIDQQVMLARKIQQNKLVTDPVAGTITVYDDDGVTVLLTASLYQDAAGTTPYSGAGADRRERLA